MSAEVTFDAQALFLAPASAGSACALCVRATPRAKRAGLAGVRQGTLLARLASPAHEGRANTELLELLSRALGVPPSRLEIQAGARGRDKRIAVPLNVETARARLARALEAAKN